MKTSGGENAWLPLQIGAYPHWSLSVRVSHRPIVSKIRTAKTQKNEININDMY